MNLSTDFTRITASDQPQDLEQDRAKEALNLPDLREQQCYGIRFHVGKSTRDQSYLDAKDIHEALKRDPESGQVGPYFDSAAGTVFLRFTKPLGVLRALEMAGDKNLEYDPPRVGRYI